MTLISTHYGATMPLDLLTEALEVLKVSGPFFRCFIKYEKPRRMTLGGLEVTPLGRLITVTLQGQNEIIVATITAWKGLSPNQWIPQLISIQFQTWGPITFDIENNVSNGA